MNDPLALFLEWFKDAEQTGMEQPEAMMLATSTPDGRPSLRTVLYRPASDGGIRFFTNYQGRKALELEANPHAAALFFWQPLKRQVRIEGTIVRASDEESDAYFASRPRLSQVSAWVSPQSRPIDDLALLEERAAELDQRYAGREVPRPEFWGGYRLEPERWEFWIAREHRLHERVLYVRSGAEWIRSLLGP